MASNFVATHTVPASGLDGWEQPDPALEPITTLGSGSEVEVIDRRGGWALVRCDDGVEAWTNASHLIPIAPPAAAGEAPTEVMADDPGALAPLAQTVGDIFTGEVPVLDARAPLDEARNIFIRLGVRVLPLWDGTGIVGVLERERLFEEIEQSSDPGTQTVQGLASTIRYCYDDAEVDSVLARMKQESVHDVVVLRRDKAVLGILSQP